MARNAVNCSTLSSQKNSFVYHEQLGKFHSDRHSHRYCQFIYAERGCVHIHSEEHKVLLPGWFGAWIPPETFHEIWSDSPQLFVPAACFSDVPPNKQLPDHLSVFPVSALVKEMLQYTERWNENDFESDEETVFLQALLNLLPENMNHSLPICLPTTQHDRLAQLLEDYQGRLELKESITYFSVKFGYSLRTLNRLFNSELGMSFSSYSKIARINKALELIHNGENQVSEIASAVGYDSLGTFSNNFREICGNSPMHFIAQRKSLRN